VALGKYGMKRSQESDMPTEPGFVGATPGKSGSQNGALRRPREINTILIAIRAFQRHGSGDRFCISST
jgi:hypothetical protein